MPPKTRIAFSALALLLAACVTASPVDYAGVLADPHRPDADRARDAARKPSEVLAFAGLKRGDKVLELIPGKGYYTRVLSRAVGPQGVIYALAPGKTPQGAATNPNPLAGDAAYGNVRGVLWAPGQAFTLPETVDVAFTAENYHDLHLAVLHLDVVALDKQIFAALKPGGVLIVDDHAAEPGSGLRDPDKLHRIDEAVVKQEAAEAGFVLEAESDIMRNPADPRTAMVYDKSVRGHTDQFLLKFRKPLR